MIDGQEQCSTETAQVLKLRQAMTIYDEPGMSSSVVAANAHHCCRSACMLPRRAVLY